MSQFLEKRHDISQSKGSIDPDFSDLELTALQFAQEQEGEKPKSVAGADSQQFASPEIKNVDNFKRKGNRPKTQVKTCKSAKIDENQNQSSLMEVDDQSESLESSEEEMLFDD